MALRCGLAMPVRSLPPGPVRAFMCVHPRQMRPGQQRVASASASSSGNSSKEPESQPQKVKAQEVSDSEQDSNQQNQAGRGPQGPLQRMLAFVLQPIPWLAKASSGSPIGAALLRVGAIAAAFILVAVARASYVASTSPRGVPREVLYSTFVTLLDTGRIRATRLESGTSRLYFDVVPLPPASTSTASDTAASPAGTPSQAVPAAATAATAAATSSKATQSAAMASSSGRTAAAAAAPAAPSTAAAAASTSAAVAAAPAVAAGAGAAGAASSAAAAAQPYRMQKQFFLKLAEKNDPALVGRILAAGVEFGVMKTSFQAALANVLLTSLALWLPLMPLIFLLKRIVDERNSSARKKKPNANAEASAVTFADVAGVESAKEELREVVAVMKAQKAAYSKLKVKMPSGVLLCGPPGTGKTLLARAVAGEAGIPFIAVSASEFVELFVGRGAARVRELFAEARQKAPCVVFIDEVDAVGTKRGMGYNDERDQTLNQLLTELDGFDQRPGVLFLAATNRIDVLDPALLRPGRISRKVVVPLPDEEGRRAILGVHLRSVPFTTQGDKLESTARTAAITAGFSGAELANVVNEASLLAARRNQEVVTMRELVEGVRRTKFGVNGRSQGAGGLLQSLDEWMLRGMYNTGSGQGSTERQVKSMTSG